MKEKLLDKNTIDAYHAYVQAEIRSDLNSISLGPGRLPTRAAQGLTIFGLCCLLVGILLVALRMRHVYFWDWEDQFVGPFFFILFLLCMGAATYLAIIATRRSNRFRREVYFRPLGDYGIAAVHKDDLLFEHEMKHDLKSGTTPHKTVMPRSEAYSAVNISKEKRIGHHNQGYRHGPEDPHRRHHDPHRRPHGGPDRRPPHPDDRRRGPPPDGRRGPPPDNRDHRRPPDGRRGPPPEDYRRGPPPGDRRGPPPGDRRGPPPDDRRGPPPDDRRGPPPVGFRGPPPDDRRGPPPDDRRGPPPIGFRGPPPDDRRGPPPDDRRGPPPDDRRGPAPIGFREPPPDSRRGPPPGGYRDDDRRGPPPDHRGPDDRRGPPPDRQGPDDRRGPPPGDRRPQGPPQFRERSPDDNMGTIRLEDSRDSESEL